MAAPIHRNTPSTGRNLPPGSDAKKGQKTPDASTPLDQTTAEEGVDEQKSEKEKSAKEEASLQDAQPETTDTAAKDEDGVRLKPHKPTNEAAKHQPARQREQSHFEKDTRYMTAAKLPEDFIGHKINTQKSAESHGEPVRDSFIPDLPDQPQITEGPKLSLPKLPDADKPLPPKPPLESYRALVSERFFKGPLKESPLHQKLTQQTIKQQSEQVERKMTDRASEPLSRPEILQLVRMRHKAEQKEKLREVLRYEIAKAKKEQAKKVQSVRYQTESHHKQGGIGKTLATRLDQAREQLAARLRESKLLSQFEAVLQKVLNGKKTVPELPEGVRARFKVKTDGEWKEFFGNTSRMGSALIKQQGEIGKLAEAIFRGLFNDTQGETDTMVADLHFLEEGGVEENKYSQVLLKDSAVMTLVRKLLPGDAVPRDLMMKLGQEFEFLKMSHLVQALAVTDEQRQEILKKMRQGHSTESQQRLENSLIARREGQDRSGTGPDRPIPWAGVPPDERLNHPGQPRFFMLMLYAIATIVVGMVVFLVLRGM